MEQQEQTVSSVSRTGASISDVADVLSVPVPCNVHTGDDQNHMQILAGTMRVFACDTTTDIHACIDDKEGGSPEEAVALLADLCQQTDSICSTLTEVIPCAAPGTTLVCVYILFLAIFMRSF